MQDQPFAERSKAVRERFVESANEGALTLDRMPRISWSIWMFGREPLSVSFRRLREAGLSYVELAGNHHTRESGTDIAEAKRLLRDHDLKVSGVCGLYSPDVDLSSDNAFRGQHALDYVRREIEFVYELGGEYLIVVPSAVGRPQPLGSEERARSAERLAQLGSDFGGAGIKAAIEPIRTDEVSLVHTVADAKKFIQLVSHDAVQHINGDVYHMLYGESHIGEAVLDAGSQLANLHLADSNRGTLGTGMIDVDTVLRAYALATQGDSERGFLTGEPLGAGRDPYMALNTVPDPDFADRLVHDTVTHLLNRWEAVKRDAVHGVSS
ncbi:MAG: sugar phosphate isomerase/epimerase family protein [Alkalispirochaeta sp.]